MYKIINIPENTDKLLKNPDAKIDWLDAEHIIDAVKNGITLPDTDSRLLVIDEKVLDANQMHLNWSCQKWVSEVGISNAIIVIIDQKNRKDEGKVDE